MQNKIILASASPRRREILDIVKIPYEVCVSDINETVSGELTPEQIAIELAKLKADAVRSKFNNDRIIIGCDTVVALKSEVFGKPKSYDEAIQMLKKLSGKIHQVYTGVCIINSSISTSFSERTDVEFWTVSDEEISEYVKTGEPMDKAGAYAIQGLGSLFVKRINGDFYNVMGLPASKLCKILKEIDDNF